MPAKANSQRQRGLAFGGMPKPSSLLAVAMVALTMASATGSGALPRWRSWWALRGGDRQPPMYEANGGTVLALAGKDFAVLAADTRLSKDMSILSRNATRMWELAPGVWLGIAGCRADVLGLLQVLRVEVDDYTAANKRPITVDAMAQLLSTTLYQRRTMPFFTFCVLVGVDATGAGAVFTYDALGSFERVRATAVGSAQAVLLPILDRLVPADVRDETSDDFFQRWPSDGTSPTAHRPGRSCDLDLPAALSGIRSAAVAASERDIRFGDRLEVVSVRATAAPKSGRVAAESRREGGVDLKVH